MRVEEYGVHQTHCCVEHGCKYGEPDCPVVSGEIVQDYTCEDCSDVGVESVEELIKKEDVEKVKEIFASFEKESGEDVSILLTKVLKKVISSRY